MSVQMLIRIEPDMKEALNKLARKEGKSARQECHFTPPRAMGSPHPGESMTRVFKLKNKFNDR
jgi:hypothetical protein